MRMSTGRFFKSSIPLRQGMPSISAVPGLMGTMLAVPSWPRRRLSRMVRPGVPGLLEIPARAMERGRVSTCSIRAASKVSAAAAGALASAVPTPSRATTRPSSSSTMGFISSRVAPSASSSSTSFQSPFRKAASLLSSVRALPWRRAPSQVLPSQWFFSSTRACSGVVKATGQSSGRISSPQALVRMPPRPSTMVQPASGVLRRAARASVGWPERVLKGTLRATRVPM